MYKLFAKLCKFDLKQETLYYGTHYEIQNLVFSRVSNKKGKNQKKKEVAVK